MDENIVRFAFYKPQDFWGWVIAGWTSLFNPGMPKCCHVEVGFFLDGKWMYYSSASRNYDGTTGTRWIEESLLFKHPKYWDVYEVTPVRPIEDMIRTCDKELGKEYDWLGIGGFATIFGRLNDKEKWYCSEICFYIFYLLWKKRVSPMRLFSKIKPYILRRVDICIA